MADLRPLSKTCAALGLLLAAACGKPEDTRGYVISSASAVAAQAVEVKTPPPPVPAVAAPFMGRGLKDISKGTAVCKGALDTVTRRHTGARQGAEIEGWGWDERGGRPLDKVLFIDAKGVVVGGAAVGAPRPDVTQAVSEVKTPNVGWRGVADVSSDEITAVGVTADGDTCQIAQTNLG